MKDLITNLSSQIREAITIADSAVIKNTEKSISGILVCGLGGSGIGGKITSLLLGNELKVPFLCVNEYKIPAWVNENTLVIASSYSGNTEETLTAVSLCHEKGAEIAVITSGGKFLEMAIANNWNHVVVPGGEQPRAMLAYSLVQQMYLLYRYGLVSDQILKDLQDVPSFIDVEEQDIQEKALEVAKSFIGKTPIIYSGNDFEGIAVRWRQQINENAKELCWHHVYPEMTHNELVGWANGSDQFVPLFLYSETNHPRTMRRWEISKEIIAKHTPTVLECKAKGSTTVEEFFYLIHFGDWVSYLMAEIKEIDSVEVDVILHLKGEMAKMK